MNRKYSILSVLLIIVTIIVCTSSCQSRASNKPIPSGKMEDILYDYHVSIGMLMSDYDVASEDRPYKEKLYKLSVLKKYGVTEAQFDESMVYYMRHADELQDIYKSLSKRIGSEASKIGASVAELAVDNHFSLSGDTANIWPMDRGLVLMQSMPYNVKSFSIKADSAFHKGDRFILSFDTQFLYQEGFKDGIAMLALKLSNDSVATRSTHFSSNSHYSLDLSDNTRIGVKEVRGFIYLGKESRPATSSTLKLLVADYIQLLRIHIREAKEIEDAQSNTVSKPSVHDSVRKARGDSVSSNGLRHELVSRDVRELSN